MTTLTLHRRPRPQRGPVPRGFLVASSLAFGLAVAVGLQLAGPQLESRFAGWLGMAIRETIVDQTGLSGWFDIDLTVSQEPSPKVPPDALTAASATSIGPFLEEQLGLKLEPTTGPVDVLVIDHVEKPTPD